MPRNIEFKNKYSLEQRKEESYSMLIKYPDRIPIICNKYYDSKMNDMDKKKFLVPINLSIAEFIFVIRKRLRISYEQSIYFIINDFIPSNNEIMYNLYKKFSDEDGFLYVFYTNENTFG